MKKLATICLLMIALVACKSETKTEVETKEELPQEALPGRTLKQSDGLTAIHGNFLYVEGDGAAVLQTPTQIYGVVIDDMMQTLNAQVATYKSEPFDMVPVTVRGRIIKKDENDEGWQYQIEIKEIMKVSEPTTKDDDVIKLGS